MDRKLQMEVNTLKKIGLPDDLALLCAGVKTGNEDVVNMVINDFADEQDALKQSLEHFRPFANLAIEPASIKKIEEDVFMEVNPITGDVKPYHGEKVEETKSP